MRLYCGKRPATNPCTIMLMLSYYKEKETRSASPITIYVILLNGVENHELLYHNETTTTVRILRPRLEVPADGIAF